MPKSGTNTAAIRVHIDDPETMNRLSSEHSSTNRKITGSPVKPTDFSPSAPATASPEPTPDQSKSAMNWPRMKASTRNGTMSLSAAPISRGTSPNPSMVRATLP